MFGEMLLTKPIINTIQSNSYATMKTNECCISEYFCQDLKYQLLLKHLLSRLLSL